MLRPFSTVTCHLASRVGVFSFMWCVYAEDRCSPAVAFLLNTGFHMPLSLSSRCTQRNQALLWTSLSQTHRWGCYYSSLLEFSGKEGLALWHTSCPLKSPTERSLSRPFQTPALTAAWKGTSGVLSQSSISWTSPPCLQSVYKPNIYCFVIFCSTYIIWSQLCVSNCRNVSNVQKLNSVGACQIDVGIYKPGLPPILLVNWSSFHHKNNIFPGNKYNGVIQLSRFKEI